MRVLVTGDCRQVLRDLPANSIDACVTDPPYGLSKEPKVREVLTHWLAGDSYAHSAGGFMGNSWDSFVPGPDYWTEVYRVLKPGAHVVVFGGSRTVDLLGISLRLAGFEIRDQLQWLYGQGFPKSKSVAMSIDKTLGAIGHRGKAFTVAGDVSHLQSMDGTAGAVGDHQAVTPEAAEWQGWGTGLKPGHEPIVLARKPFKTTVAKNVLKHRTGAINIDGCRVPDEKDLAESLSRNPGSRGGPAPVDPGSSNTYDTVNARPQQRVNLSGRWPANVLLDEEAAALLNEQSGELRSGTGTVKRKSSRAGTGNTSTALGKESRPEGSVEIAYGDKGGASRFFYVAKASTRERHQGCDDLFWTRDGRPVSKSEWEQLPDSGRRRGNVHPTVKPVALMRWLMRLVTPPGGTVLDPFVGSGTTGVGAEEEGFSFIGIELEADSAAIAEARVGATDEFVAVYDFSDD